MQEESQWKGDGIQDIRRESFRTIVAGKDCRTGERVTKEEEGSKKSSKVKVGCLGCLGCVCHKYMISLHLMSRVERVDSVHTRVGTHSLTGDCCM